MIKAQNYQMRGDNLVIYGFIVSVVVLLAATLVGNDLSEMNGGLYAINCFMVVPFIFCILSLLLATRCVGFDMNDKTINYEILSGHSRKESYWGRVLAAFIWCLAGCFFITFIPSAIVTLIKGWGANVTFSEMALSYTLLFFPIFRIICEYILLTIIFRDSNKGLVLGFLLFDGSVFVSMFATELFDIERPIFSTFGNIISITEVSNYKMQMVDGKEIQVFDFMPDTSLIVSTVLVSLVIGIACLVIGSKIFKEHDMD